MNNKSKILLAGVAGIAALAASTPANAQYGGNVIGSIINSVLGYGQYPYGNYGYGQPTYMSSQVAVNQCARAAEQRLNYAGRGYANPYDNGYYGNPYNSPYANSYQGWAVQGQGRVLGIEKVTMKSMGRLRVMGVATSGRTYRNNWGYGGYAYNRSYGAPDLKFVCNADQSGRVYDVNFSRYGY